jgi:hypothetical protein
MDVTHIFLSGHGGWTPSNGFTKVPARCTVHFYTHFAKLLMTGMSEKILRGTWKQAERSHGAFMMVPNMTLYGQPAEWTEKAERQLNRSVWGNDADIFAAPDEDDKGTLSELFDLMTEDGPLPLEVHFHWLCCSHVSLRKAGGADIGFNASDFIHNPNYQGLSGRYRNKNKNGVFKPIIGELKRRTFNR